MRAVLDSSGKKQIIFLLYTLSAVIYHDKKIEQINSYCVFPL